MSESPKSQKHNLWHKYNDHELVRLRIENLPSSEEEPSVSDIKQEIAKFYRLEFINVTLQIRRSTDADYEVLNDDLFNNCGNNYVTLKDNFEITKNNPIIVNSVEG
jgi:hypothetical protein